jgi:anti-sigma B factor antagonist
MHTGGPLSEIRDRDVLIVKFADEIKQIDEINVAEIGKKLLDITENLTRPLLVIDMTSIEFFGSSFIEVLFRVWKRLSTKPEPHLAISGLQSYCREVLKVTHLDSLWQIFDTYQAASDAFNAPKPTT